MEIEGNEREAFTVVTDHSNKVKNGFYLKKTTAIALLVGAILLIVITGVIAAYLGPGKGRKTANVGGQGGTKPTMPPKTKKPMTQASSTKPKTTDSTKKPYMNIRLPAYVKPKHYNVALNVDLKKLMFVGKSSVEFDVQRSTEYLFIHVADLKINKATVNMADGTELQVKEKMEYKKNEYYVFVMASAVSPGQYSMHFEFESKLNENLKGLYKSTYKRKNGKSIVIAATQFQPTDARRAFPCFDEPALKATFNISLIHDPNFIAISNMPIISTTVENGLTRDNFQKTVKMPTYLLAFVVCDFKNKTVKTSSNVSMTFYAPPDQVDQLTYAVKVGKSILPYFESYYNITYPLPKADMIAIPDFAAGAMENWGLITYRETALLFSSGQSSESNKQRVAVVISHELAHQWFGNLVTTEWWSDLWLNEGFASYVEYFGVNFTEPNWRMMDQIVIADQASAFAADALVTSHPIYVPVYHPNEINEIFDSISYQKGGSILMMLDRFLGHDTFLKGLNSYLNKYKFGNARTEDLWNSLSKASNNKYNVSRIMDTWTRQMGFPVVNITRSGNDYIVTQQRFLLDPNPDYTKEKYQSPYGYKWYVPFEYSTGTINSTGGTPSAPTTVWLNKTSALIKGVPNNQWIKGNLNQYGFYRVMYDQKGWNDLVSQMKMYHMIFDPKDRAGILGDAFALSRAGMLNYETTLDLFDYIDKDDDYIAWRAASDGISHIGSMFSKTSLAGRNLPKYILKKTMPLYNKLGFKESTGDNKHIETYLRSIILSKACGNGLPECLSNATSLFNKWMVNTTKNAVPADLRSLVYFYGILNGGEKEWNFAFKEYQSTTLGSERVKLLYGMSAIQEPWMIERYLNYSMDDTKVKSQDTSYIFSYISNYNPIGRYYAWYFMKSNWDQIRKKFGGGFFTMRRIFGSVTSGFKTEYELKQFDKFVNTLKDTGTATRTITQSRERIKSNIFWLSRNEKTIAEWLRKKMM